VLVRYSAISPCVCALTFSTITPVPMTATAFPLCLLTPKSSCLLGQGVHAVHKHIYKMNALFLGMSHERLHPPNAISHERLHPPNGMRHERLHPPNVISHERLHPPNRVHPAFPAVGIAARPQSLRGCFQPTGVLENQNLGLAHHASGECALKDTPTDLPSIRCSVIAGRVSA